jgi:hypothetical protein
MMEQQLEFHFVTQASSVPMPAAKKPWPTAMEQQREREAQTYRRLHYGYGRDD